MKIYDIIIIGAGAAGLSAAAAALIREKAVALIDMGNAPARKLSISGGGKCNFTNLAVSSSKYFGNNPNFVNGVINKISPQYFINWIEKHGLEFEKKSSGQYFCATNAKDIVSAMKNDARNADIILNSTVLDIEKNADIFYIKTKEKIFMSKSVIIATGGISYPALGVSDFGYKIAKKFGHKIIPIRPALCAISTKVFPSNLAGISLKVEINIENEKINDFMLITHFGIGGPVIYRTTARNIEKGFKINLLPDINIFEWLKNFKNTEGKKNLGNILSYKLPKRLAKWL